MKRRGIKRFWAVLLTVVLLGTQLPAVVMAENMVSEEDGDVMQVEDLEDETLYVSEPVYDGEIVGESTEPAIYTSGEEDILPDGHDESSSTGMPSTDSTVMTKEEALKVVVGGTDVTAGGAWKIVNDDLQEISDGDWVVKYDKNSNMLTLKEAEITKHSENGGVTAGIYIQRRSQHPTG